MALSQNNCSISASFRIMDAGYLHSEIEERTNLVATTKHIKGEIINKHSGRQAPRDVWLINTRGNRNNIVGSHLGYLVIKLRPHIDFLKGLVKQDKKK